MLKMILLALGSALLAAGFAGAAKASLLYSVDRSAPCFSDCTGNITVQGFIEVDSLGVLTPANVVDWELILNSTNFADTGLTPANSEFIFGTNLVEATVSELIITLPAGSGELFAVLNLASSVDVFWALQEVSSSSFEVLSNIPTSPGPGDQAQQLLGPSPIIVSLPALSALPEPATIALFGLGLAGLGLAARRRRQPAPA